MEIASSEILKNIDNYCMEKLNIPGIILMENAALKILKNVAKDEYKKYLIICGSGNNGGDGFALSRQLKLFDKDVKVIMVGDESKVRDLCKVNMNAAEKFGVPIVYIKSQNDLVNLRIALISSDVVIDAVFGTGLNREIEGILLEVINYINELSKYTISVDVPSGLNSDNGEIEGNCVRADKTITFQLYKKGFLEKHVKDYTGEIIVENIGIPDSVVSRFQNGEYLSDDSLIKKWSKKRDVYGHKGSFGSALVIAGSMNYTGAAYVATSAAVKTGCGIVYIATSKDAEKILKVKLNEGIVSSYDDLTDLYQLMRKSDAIALGPGMGNTEKTLKLLLNMIEKSKCPLVIDADGINVIKDNILSLREEKNIILTPHPLEMARLTGFSVDYINKNRIEVSKKFALDNNVIILLKGYNTIITDGKSVYVNSTGSSAMATGGMGDCLTGILVALLAQNYKPLEAAVIAAYIHGEAGDELSKNMYSVTASDVIEELPITINKILGIQNYIGE